MIENLKLEDFAAQLDTKFRMKLADGKILECELVQAKSLSAAPGQEVFSLVFRAPLDAPRATQIYSLEHESLGALDLFLSPIKADGQGLYYEAVFNRLVKK